MFELLYQFGLKWLYYKDPMTETERQRWDKMRKRGIIVFVLGFSVVLGGAMFVFGLAWDHFVEHKSIDVASFVLRAVAYLFVAAFLATVDWYVKESRYRQVERSSTVAQTK